MPGSERHQPRTDSDALPRSKWHRESSRREPGLEIGHFPACASKLMQAFLEASDDTRNIVAIGRTKNRTTGVSQLALATPDGPRARDAPLGHLALSRENLSGPCSSRAWIRSYLSSPENAGALERRSSLPLWGSGLGVCAWLSCPLWQSAPMRRWLMSLIACSARSCYDSRSTRMNSCGPNASTCRGKFSIGCLVLAGREERMVLKNNLEIVSLDNSRGLTGVTRRANCPKFAIHESPAA